MSAKYIKTDSWIYVNPPPPLLSTFQLVYFYERYTLLKCSTHFSDHLPAFSQPRKWSRDAPSSLSPCELFGNRANNFPTRLYPAPRCLPSFLTLFLADKSRGISRPNLFVSRANIFQRLFYESLAGRDFFHHFFHARVRIEIKIKRY